MATLQSKRFEEPDETVDQPLVRQEIVTLGEVYVARITHQPGWKWSQHMQPIIGTARCMHHHLGILVSGEMEFGTAAGARRRVRAGDAYEVPPGHDAWVVGDEPAVAIEFAGVRGWGKPPEYGERVVATLLVTDIVDSTATAVRLGDAAWKQVLARHADRVRLELERYHGVEIATTGDGVLAMFDGAVRAVRCAAAIAEVARLDGLEVRAGIHSGEVERTADNLRGVAVHATTRIAALAGPGDVFVSSGTVGLLEGLGVALEDAGEHELKGLPGLRRLYRLRREPA
jgi:class 3 adenylate cyclase